MGKWTTNIDITCGAYHGDETCGYNITLNKEMTVREFIDEILKEKPNEWGYFGIYSKKDSIFGEPHCEYSQGQLITDPIPDEFLNKKIDKVDGNGGWSRSDYIFHVSMDEEKITADDVIDAMDKLKDNKYAELRNHPAFRILFEALDLKLKQISCLKSEIECRKKIDKLTKEYFESHIGDTITKEMIDDLWGE